MLEFQAAGACVLVDHNNIWGSCLQPQTCLIRKTQPLLSRSILDASTNISPTLSGKNEVLTGTGDLSRNRDCPAYSAHRVTQGCDLHVVHWRPLPNRSNPFSVIFKPYSEPWVSSGLQALGFGFVQDQPRREPQHSASKQDFGDITRGFICRGLTDGCTCPRPNPRPARSDPAVWESKMVLTCMSVLLTPEKAEIVR